MGPGPSDTKELTVLSRALRWVDGGVKYEADRRKGERPLEGLGLAGDNCKSMATPGQKLEVEKLKEDKPLSQDEHTVFRALAARANLSLSRSDRFAICSKRSV